MRGTPPQALLVGPSGWEYPDWRGAVYPRRVHPLEHLSNLFDAAEIESTFQHPAPPEVSRLWLAKVAHNQAFRFTATLNRRFTHARSLEPAEVAKFEEGLWPILRADRFGCLVLQFPWAFRFTAENREFLISLRRAFHEFPMAVEMRHRSWLADEALGTLIDYRLGFVNVDQPDYASAMPPTALVTSPVGYVRLHGRDKDYWNREFRSAAGVSDYLYSNAELSQWKDKIEHVSARADTTFVVFANAAGGKSVVNALQLERELGIKPVVRAPCRAA